jgi:hypothetical protein
MFMCTSSSDWSQTNFRSDLVFDLAQTARDHLKFIGGENSGAGKSGSVRNGSGNIVVVETAIEGNRLAVTLRDFRAAEENLPSLMITSLQVREPPSLKHSLRRAKQICALRLRPCAN